MQIKLSKNTHESSLFQWSVIEQFFDQVNMTEQHTSATIPPETKGVQSISEKQNNLISTPNKYR